jgi:hypothetical protein
MSTTTKRRRRPSARAIREAALAAAQELVNRAEQRAKTCGGRPNEYISPERFEALRRAVRGEEHAA